QVDLSSITLVSWLGWIYLVTFGALIGFTAYIYLLNHVSPAKASTYAYVNPIVAGILGLAVAGEPVTPRTLRASPILPRAVASITMGGGGGVTIAARSPSVGGGGFGAG